MDRPSIGIERDDRRIDQYHEQHTHIARIADGHAKVSHQQQRVLDLQIVLIRRRADIQDNHHGDHKRRFDQSDDGETRGVNEFGRGMNVVLFSCDWRRDIKRWWWCAGWWVHVTWRHVDIRCGLLRWWRWWMVSWKRGGRRIMNGCRRRRWRWTCIGFINGNENRIGHRSMRCRRRSGSKLLCADNVGNRERVWRWMNARGIGIAFCIGKSRCVVTSETCKCL